MTSSGKSPGSAPLQQILLPLAWYTFPKLYSARAWPTWRNPREKVLLLKTYYLMHHIFGSCVFRYLTLSLMSLAMSKCLWQQTTASSNLPSTFNVLPRFPLALASPSRSPIVLPITDNLSYNRQIYALVELWSSGAGPTWLTSGRGGGNRGL